MTKSKFIPYGKQAICKKDIRAVLAVLKSPCITQGPKVAEFEKALCEYTGASYAVAVSSGTAALHLAMLAAGVKQGDEVITSPLTFVASANCILYCAAKPVFADIQKDTANIEPDKIRGKITSKTKAIIPVHYAGHPSDLEKIHKIAKGHKLIIIEDAAHALGAEYKGFKVGSCQYSDMTIFSFHPIKSITTGEGGAILTNSRKYYQQLVMLREHGITRDEKKFKISNNGHWYYEMHYLGYNYRLTDMQCALGVSQLKKLNQFIQRRRQIAKIYNQRFQDNSFFDLPVEKDYVKSSWHLYPIRLKDKLKIKKKAIFDKLRRKGIGAQVHYIPVYLQPYYQRLGYSKKLCTNAKDFYQKEISIPIYPAMSNKDADYVLGTIIKIFEGFIL